MGEMRYSQSLSHTQTHEQDCAAHINSTEWKTKHTNARKSGAIVLVIRRRRRRRRHFQAMRKTGHNRKRSVTLIIYINTQVK